MAWADFPDTRQSIGLLRRSLERDRLGHAYLFSGDSPALLERVAREFAMTVNCQAAPEVSPRGLPTAACGTCSSCRRIREGQHPDVHWLRAESKLRVIKVEQVRDLCQAAHLKGVEARVKVGVLLGADRMNSQAANAFLKTLEEPPPGSLLILTTTEPDRVLETLVSRCLRLTFPGQAETSDADLQWLREFAGLVEQPPRSLLTRYRLLDVLLRRLAELREGAEEEVSAKSPAQQHRDADPGLKERWETEEKAAVEAEFRLRRSQALGQLQAWFRDVWAFAVGLPRDLLTLPSLAGPAEAVARRLDPERAVENLALLERTQASLHTNVQEALALEVALLKLHV